VIAALRPRSGDADLRNVSVELPRGERVDPRRLEAVCTRERFAAEDCPPASLRGTARAWSPLLDAPLQGPVYLRESSGRYPDLVAALDGQFPLTLVAHLSTPNARIRVGFASLPDIRLSRVELVLAGGRHGLLSNSEGLCRGGRRATIDVGAYNGKTRELRPRVRADCSGEG